jgi:hypothetical protein
MALPVIRGPVFPGVLTPVTVTDKVRLLACLLCLLALLKLKSILTEELSSQLI